MNLTGTMQVHVHFYEDGNVQVRSSWTMLYLNGPNHLGFARPTDSSRGVGVCGGLGVLCVCSVCACVGGWVWVTRTSAVVLIIGEQHSKRLQLLSSPPRPSREGSLFVRRDGAAGFERAWGAVRWPEWHWLLQAKSSHTVEESVAGGSEAETAEAVVEAISKAEKTYHSMLVSHQ